MSMFVCVCPYSNNEAKYNPPKMSEGMIVFASFM